MIMLAGLQGSGKTTLAGKLGGVAQGAGAHAAAGGLRPAAAQRRQPAADRRRARGRADVRPGARQRRRRPGRRRAARRRARPRQALRHRRRRHRGPPRRRRGADAAGRRTSATPCGPTRRCSSLDAMVGQDAVTTAEAFRDGVGFTGVVLTKLDGDARGGAALSVREVTGVPILFASNGEKLADFDVFHPDRMASRILGMGDLLTLIEQAEQAFDAEQAAAAAAKMGSGELTPRGLPRADARHPQDGPDRQHPRHAAGRQLGPDEGGAGAGRRPPTRPHPGHHPRHDPRRAVRSQDHQRVAAAAHRQRFGRHRRRRQRPGQPLLRSPQDDEADGRAVRLRQPQRHAAAGQGPQGQEAAATGARAASRRPPACRTCPGSRRRCSSCRRASTSCPPISTCRS